MSLSNEVDYKDPLRISIGNRNSGTDLPLNRVKTTKYNWFTFIPLNLYKQFRRAVYFYFLIITIVSFFINNTISPLTALLPLLFVMFVTALKEGLEDLSRSKSDKLINETSVIVIRNGQERRIKSEYIVPGDLVVVASDSDVPCDLVLIESSEADNKCYITTANLDGETSVKTIFAPKIDGQHSQAGLIVCEPATADLYNYNGRIEVNNGGHGTIVPLTIENLLMRGVRLSGTARIVGCAVYTGMHTKIQLNSRYTGNKAASSESYINKHIIALIIGMVLVVAILCALQRKNESPTAMPHLGIPTDGSIIVQTIEEFFSMLILFNYMIPISMYMNIELYRVIGAIFIRSDLQLYDEDADQPCAANTSNLNEDLGQINILFSDKTGTITKNQMILLKCFVAARTYRLENQHLYCQETATIQQLSSFNRELQNFVLALCLCHTVQVLEIDAQKFKYTAANMPLEQLNAITHDIVARYQVSSPDERGLLEGCAKLGYVFAGHTNSIASVYRFVDNHDETWHMQQLQFERLQVLEFTSERKRMSIIVRDAKGTIWLYSKGAESSIFPLCKQGSLIEQVDNAISAFATEGLRTLAVASRTLTDAEYCSFMDLHNEASSALNNRKELIAKCYETVECELELLGATALEDALQANVDETMAALRAADLKIWILTGDKVETALNISLACKHIPEGATIHHMLNISDGQALLERLDAIAKSMSESNALVIDGITVSTVLQHAAKEFGHVALKSDAVLCCRLSPLQKSKIVALVKKTKHIITAAVGDGANDVSMIQEAHLGIGIVGREGRQAAQCSDYAIARFNMLHRLILVHGHYNSARLTFLVLFYSYKNIVITGCMALYQIYDLYSATSVYNSLYLWLFDIVYLSYSFTYLAISEKPYSEETLLSNPSLYKKLAHNKQANLWVFAKWVLNGFFHTIVIFYFAYAMTFDNNVGLSAGQTIDFACFGTMLMQMVIIVGNLKLILLAHHMTFVNLALIFISIAAFMLSTYIYNIINSVDLYWAYNMFMSSLPIWLYTIICSAACLLPDLFIKVINELLQNRSSQIATKPYF